MRAGKRSRLAFSLRRLWRAGGARSGAGRLLGSLDIEFGRGMYSRQCKRFMRAFRQRRWWLLLLLLLGGGTGKGRTALAADQMDDAHSTPGGRGGCES